MLDEKGYRSLGQAVETSYRKLDPFRKLAKALVTEYVGPGYGDAKENDTRHKYLNLMNQTVDAYMMLLAANTPRVLVSTHNREHAGFASHFKVAINNLLKEINFGATHYDFVLDAFFCIGVIKVHMADSGQVLAEGDVQMDPGSPYASNVSIDDLVYDTTARKLSEVSFIGDMYRIPFEKLKDEHYDKDVVRNLKPTSKYAVDGERIEQISTGTETDDDEFRPMIDLCDIYVPSDGMIYTFPVTNRQLLTLGSVPVAKFEWMGTEKGPYKVLGFNTVPKNIMPVSPASHLADLDLLINNLMGKQARQAQRQKENLLYSPSGAEDALRIVAAADGEAIKVNDAKEFNVTRFGGSDAGNQRLLVNSVEMFDRMAGNLPAMMGLGASSDTVGQEKLIHASASRKEGQMQRRVVEAITDVIYELAFLLWQDEFKEIPGEVELEGMPQFKAQSNWTPDDREGDFKDYAFEIDVHSMSYQSPADRVKAINSLIGQIYAPMMQMLQQQGGSIDFAKLTSIYAELLNLPRLNEVITFTSPIDDGTGGIAMGGPGKPATTERRYVRQDGPKGSASGLSAPDPKGMTTAQLAESRART